MDERRRKRKYGDFFKFTPGLSDDRRHLSLFTDRFLFNIAPVVCVRQQNRAIKYVA